MRTTASSRGSPATVSAKSASGRVIGAEGDAGGGGLCRPDLGIVLDVALLTTAGMHGGASGICAPPPYSLKGGGLLDERLWTVREVAEKLSVSRKTVHQWVRAGDLRCIRLGQKTVRIEESELERFLRERYEEPF